jgi:hypothetical protein
MADEFPPIQSTGRFRVPLITTKNLSVVIFGAVAIFALMKAKQEDIPIIVKTLVDSYLFCAIGWILAVVVLLSSVVLIKLLMRFYDREVARLSKERDELQTRLLKK